jgi:hypothetical protein
VVTCFSSRCLLGANFQVSGPQRQFPAKMEVSFRQHQVFSPSAYSMIDAWAIWRTR